MFEIIGVQLKSFTATDGTTITGYNVWFTEDRKDVDGLAADRIFVSDRVSNRSNFTPHVGDIIESINYNKFGRLFEVRPYRPE